MPYSTKNSWMSAITPRENSVEKMQVFCPWSSFKMSVWSVRRRTSSASSTVAGRPFAAANWSSCWSMAVLRNIARIVGAGPLMVMETDVLGSQRSKPS